jgi:N-ethylmaleimide reductase
MQDARTTPSSEAKERQLADLLFQPMELGPYRLPHRIVMAPLTRSRAGQPGNVPTRLMACYYAQRASAALIISEATQVSMQGQGYAWTPGIHSREQVDGWRMVADAVHAAGGRIFMQLWHVGRISHPALQPDRMLPVAPSRIRPRGMAFIENVRGEAELVPFVVPRALETIEMRYVVAQFERAAVNAKHAEMDGVEIHAANGYLIDQFLESGTNKRTDAYGGRLDHRWRFLLEVVDSVTGVWGPQFVGVRISPLSTFNDIHDDDPEVTFSRVSERLNPYGLAYLHVVNPAKSALEEGNEPTRASLHMLDLIRTRYRGKLILAGGFDLETAEKWLREGRADLIAFGRKFLANPDLPERFRKGSALNVDDSSTYYGGGAKGYTDYSTLAQQSGKQPAPCADQTWR